MNLLGKTPEDWRHVRVDELDGGLFAVRAFYCHGRFGPLALLALGERQDAKTEGIPLADALALGQRLETAIVTMDNLPRERRRRSKD